MSPVCRAAGRPSARDATAESPSRPASGRRGGVRPAAFIDIETTGLDRSDTRSSIGAIGRSADAGRAGCPVGQVRPRRLENADPTALALVGYSRDAWADAVDDLPVDALACIGPARWRVRPATSPSTAASSRGRGPGEQPSRRPRPPPAGHRDHGLAAAGRGCRRRRCRSVPCARPSASSVCAGTSRSPTRASLGWRAGCSPNHRRRRDPHVVADESTILRTQLRRLPTLAGRARWCWDWATVDTETRARPARGPRRPQLCAAGWSGWTGLSGAADVHRRVYVCHPTPTIRPATRPRPGHLPRAGRRRLVPVAPRSRDLDPPAEFLDEATGGRTPPSGSPGGRGLRRLRVRRAHQRGRCAARSSCRWRCPVPAIVDGGA